jgi:hypothetical protein
MGVSCQQTTGIGHGAWRIGKKIKCGIGFDGFNAMPYALTSNPEP